MPNYLEMYDSKWLRCADLEGEDRVMTIEKVKAGTVGQGEDAEAKPIIWFVGVRTPFAANKTNGKTISNLYGRDTENWVGKSVTLFPTTTEYGGEMVECIRIRPEVPGRKAAKSHTLPIATGKKAVRR
jgi:hypothetical protein